MEEDAEEIESLDPTEKQEEPWCSKCHRSTDYRRKWDAVNRSDLEGGYYSESIEVPHCIECGNSMLLVSTSRNLVWSVNLLALLAWIIGFLCVVLIFQFSIGSILGLLIHSSICVLFSRLPQKSKSTLQSWKTSKKEKTINELLQKM